MVNIILPDHVDDVPVVEPNQYDDVLVVPEPVLEDEDEDPKEEEFEEEEDPQEEDNMEVDIEEDENEPELTYPYEEVDPLNPPPLASDSEPEDVIEVENQIKHEDETVPASVHEESLVEKLGNAEDKIECKKLKNELEEARIMPPKSAPLTQAVIRQMIKESVDAAIAAERARHSNVGNDARGSGPFRGQDAAPAVRKFTFAGFMKCNPTAFHGTKGAVKLLRWFKKTESVFGINECAESKKVKFAAVTLQGPALTWWNAKRFNELALMCSRMVKPERVKVDAYIQGLTDNIKVEVTSSKPANLNEAVHIAHKLMEQKSQARDERILEGTKRKITKSKGTHELWLPLLLMEMCLLDHFLCVNDVLLAMLVCVLSSVERSGIRQAYAIKDAEPKGPNVVTDTFLLNNRYAFVLIDSGFDRSFVDTRYSSMLNIDPVKIRASYEVELADGRVVSMNTVLKGCTLNLVNHIFEIDLIPIELG
ncbi:hypothetical protein Tco_0476291, partial [Tanacetum coccineum]